MNNYIIETKKLTKIYNSRKSPCVCFFAGNTGSLYNKRCIILVSNHKLPEISMLADDIGIIDKGMLLEEECLAEVGACEDSLEEHFKRITGGERIA